MKTAPPMKNLMLYVVEDLKADLDSVRRLLELQVENSLDLGWQADDIVLFTSFPFTCMGVSAIEVAADGRPRTARATSFHKTRCILEAFDLLPEGGVFWYHDADAYQLQPITSPPSAKALAFSLYTTRERQLVQGGSMFISGAARPVFLAVEDLLVNHRCRKDEFALTDVVGRPEFYDLFAVLDGSYNLGTTDFELRFQLAEQPIKVAHFHLGRPAHRAVFLEGGNSLGAFPLPDRFVRLLARHSFVDPDELTRSLLERGRRATDYEVSRDYGSTRWQSLRKRLPWGR
jgi:hypothetical protein